MKIYALVLVLIFAGIIGLYVWLGNMGGGEQLQQDKLLASELQGQQALDQKRPDLALKYFDKALGALNNTPESPLRGKLQSSRGEALRALGRCEEARQAWAEACRLGQSGACKLSCP
ncbi:MAG: hypothetical protein CVV27_05300 [Candidatus Melainabacteria bacterium HGW-Melainabacteria-1]|nr:MAG: hypothetical protein CVV27_05300 [Candidatus Melainabacteria bacterium HGW-Melainabacteria-1]